MNLKTLSNTDLTSRLERLVLSERKLTHIILLHILEVESRRVYAQLGFDGMFSYLTKGLGYSESAAYRRLQSARLLKAIPDLSKKLEAGSLNLSQLTRVQKCIKVDATHSTFSNSDDFHLGIKKRLIETVLQKIENKNTFETKKILAQEFNQPIHAETIVIPQKDDSVRIELTFTKKQFEELEKAQSLLSHVVHNNSLAEVIDHLAKKFNKRVLGKEIVDIEGEKVDQKANINTNTITITNINTNTNTETNTETSLKINVNTNMDRNTFETKNPRRNLTQRFAATAVKRSKLSIKERRSLMSNAKHTCQ